MIEGVRHADTGGVEATKKRVWHSRTLWNSEESFGFSCEQLEKSHDDLIDLLHRFQTAEVIADDELPKVMWCSKAEDDRKSRLPHLFMASGLLVASQEMKELLEVFDLDQVFGVFAQNSPSQPLQKPLRIAKRSEPVQKISYGYGLPNQIGLK